MKKCTTCLKLKAEDSFSENSYVCKECDNARRKAYLKTFKGFTNNLLTNLFNKLRNENKMFIIAGSKSIAEDKMILFEYLISNEIYKQLFKEWEDSGFTSEKRPQLLIPDNKYSLIIDDLIIKQAATPDIFKVSFDVDGNIDREKSTKLCSKCKQYKPFTQFQTSVKNHYQITSYCKECATNIDRTPLQKLKNMYWSQVNRSRKRNHPAPDYKLNWFIDRFIKDEKYLNLFQQWKDSGFRTELAPSIDRIDNKLPYTVDNIELVTWAKNNERGSKVKRVKVEVFDLDGRYIRSFLSIGDASRGLSISRAAVSNVCTGRLKSVKGFQFKFANDPKEMRKVVAGSTKKIEQYDVNGNFIKTFFSIKEASEKTGIKYATISNIASGRTKSKNGYDFRFAGKERMVKSKVNDLATLITKRDKEPPILGKRISQYTLDGEYVKTFTNAVEAAKELGIERKIINKRAVSHNEAYGYQWRYGVNKAPIGKLKSKSNMVIKQFDSDGKEVGMFLNVTIAAKKTKIYRKGITEVLKGKLEHIKGMVFRYHYATTEELLKLRASTVL